MEHFPTTAWSLIRLAQDKNSPEALAAFNRCIAGYWKPIFYFLRARGCSPHRSEDLTQEFFLKFYERNWLDRADPERGRFRSYLLLLAIAGGNRAALTSAVGRAPTHHQKACDRKPPTRRSVRERCSLIRNR